MTIKSKLFGAYAIITVLVLMLLCMEYFSMQREAYQIRRISLMHQEYTQLISLNLNILRQMKNSADYFVTGKSAESSKFAAASLDVAVSFKNIKNVVETERNFLTANKISNVEKEHGYFEEIWHKHNELNKEFNRVFDLAKVDRTAARNLMVSILELRFDQELLPLINKWVTAEENELFEVAKIFVENIERQRLVINAFSIIILIVVISLALSFNKLIANRLKQLIAKTREVSAGNLRTKISATGNDEITDMASSFNHMIRQLIESQNKLLEQSYQSGMAEMASGMLHNLKNVFAPVVIRLDASRLIVSHLQMERFAIAADELISDKTDHDRRIKLRKYIKLSMEKFQWAVDELAKNISIMRERTGVIERILKSQNQFTFAKRPVEQLRLIELIDDAVMLEKKVLADKIKVDISQQIADIPTLRSHRIVLLQIIANLLANAAESIIVSGVKDGLIRLEAKVADKDEKEIIHLQIIDNGGGIKPEKLESIFRRGYSSKNNVSTGLGLHWCANSIGALKGRMKATSKGIGHGATIHLYIPFNLNADD